jgi:hypothetical protein
VPLLDEVETALRGGKDRVGLDRVQRALRERRERADRLHLVSEELDAERIAPGRREDVDQPAANGELTTVVHALDPLVAREREHLREAVDTELAPWGELDRHGPRIDRWQPFGDGMGRRADEPTAGQDVEGTCTLADEVGRRLEPRLPADAAARQVADDVVSEEPGSGLRRVACVRVLGQQAEKRPPELLVERPEDDRQGRLGRALAQRLASSPSRSYSATSRTNVCSTGRSMTNGGTGGFRAFARVLISAG